MLSSLDSERQVSGALCGWRVYAGAGGYASELLDDDGGLYDDARDGLLQDQKARGW
jgi:hypothetical protein